MLGQEASSSGRPGCSWWISRRAVGGRPSGWCGAAADGGGGADRSENSGTVGALRDGVSGTGWGVNGGPVDTAQRGDSGPYRNRQPDNRAANQVDNRAGYWCGAAGCGGRVRPSDGERPQPVPRGGHHDPYAADHDTAYGQQLYPQQPYQQPYDLLPSPGERPPPAPPGTARLGNGLAGGRLAVEGWRWTAGGWTARTTADNRADYRAGGRCGVAADGRRWIWALRGYPGGPARNEQGPEKAGAGTAAGVRRAGSGDRQPAGVPRAAGGQWAADRGGHERGLPGRPHRLRDGVRTTPAQAGLTWRGRTPAGAGCGLPPA